VTNDIIDAYVMSPATKELAVNDNHPAPPCDEARGSTASNGYTDGEVMYSIADDAKPEPIQDKPDDVYNVLNDHIQKHKQHVNMPTDIYNKLGASESDYDHTTNVSIRKPMIADQEYNTFQDMKTEGVYDTTSVKTRGPEMTDNVYSHAVANDDLYNRTNEPNNRREMTDNIYSHTTGI